MKTIRTNKLRGFTLIELMLVVAMISVISALALYSITAYLEDARSAEAKNFVRSINKGAHSAYERESTGANVLVDGVDTKDAHRACDSAQPVPAAIPENGHKYQPATSEGSDFNTGDSDSGWKCVKFQTNDPIYFQYSYYWQDTAVNVAQRDDWQRNDGWQLASNDTSFTAARLLMGAKDKEDKKGDDDDDDDKANNGKGTNKDGGIDGDGNNGHGNNEDHCDPDNPGKSGKNQCAGDDDDDDSAQSGDDDDDDKAKKQSGDDDDDDKGDKSGDDDDDDKGKKQSGDDDDDDDKAKKQKGDDDDDDKGNKGDDDDDDKGNKGGDDDDGGNAGGGDDDDGGNAGGGNDSPGNLEPWCVTNCFEAGAKSDNIIYLVVTWLTEAGLQSRTVMMYRK